MVRNLVFFQLLLLLPFAAYAQKGPGGVSTDVAGPNSDNKAWLDANSLNLSDGDKVSDWYDESPSAIANDAYQNTSSAQPTYRDDPSISINGQPVLQWQAGDVLLLNTSADLNNGGPYTERTNFFVLRTGADVTTRQMIYEQGGTVRGLNVYIYNGDLYYGAYDLVDDDGGGNDTSWGYTYTTTAISANTTYVITHVFNGDPNPTPSGTMGGYLNGVAITDATGIGRLDNHGDAPGIGAINSDSYNDLGSLNNQTGSQPFLGAFAEWIAYEKVLNDAERTIVENYLGAKYGAALLAGSDRFDYETNYGNEVIGIGQENGGSHNNSQGRNLFTISADGIDTDGDFFITGHNNNAFTYTTTGAPSIGTERMGRVWRTDHSGDVGNVTVSIDASEFTEFQTTGTYTKHVLIVDESNTASFNFNSSSTKVIEMDNTSGTIWEATTTIADGAYITIGRVDPTASFTLSSSVLFEADVNQAGPTVDIELNYIPIADTDVGFNVQIDATDHSATNGTVTILAGASSQSIAAFNIIGDMVAETTETFDFTLSAGGTSPGIDLGAANTHTMTIYDDDSPPQIGFSTVGPVAYNENAGLVTIDVTRSGDNSTAVSVDYRISLVPPDNGGTATIVDDYTFTAGTLNFAASGSNTQSFTLNIQDDGDFELTETIILELHNIGAGASFRAGETLSTLEINDNDNQPTVQFNVTAQTGPENNGAPSVTIDLSGTTPNDVTVEFAVANVSTQDADYTVSPGVITIPAGTTSIDIPNFFVVQDGVVEADEILQFSLLNNGNLTNATLGANTTHDYTITDFTYSTYQSTGAAGVGESADNVFWFRAHEESITDQGTLTDQSGNGSDASALSGTQEATNQNSVMNSLPALKFNESENDGYNIPNNTAINDGTQSEKAIFVVFRTGPDVTMSNAQIIFEQGGQTNGLNLYIGTDGRLYSNIWKTGSESTISTATALSTNTGYVATMLYNSPDGELFLDGASVGSFTGFGDIPAHTGLVGLGRVDNDSQLAGMADYAGDGLSFDGHIAEIVYYNEASLINESRRRIVETSLAAKYGISLSYGSYFSYGNTHPYNIVGIGQLGVDDNAHLEAQGENIVNVGSASSMDDNDFLFFGSDGAALDNFGETTDVPGGLISRITRTWRAAVNGAPGDVTLKFDLSNPMFDPIDSDLLTLMVDGDGDFSIDADQTRYGGTFNTTSEVLTVANVSLNDGDYFTLAKSDGTPLPVELVGFEARVVDEEVVLNWETTTEINNDYFEIERSTDGIDFRPIGSVDGHGNTVETINYQFIDPYPNVGINYYRLVQVDYDGTISYSPTISAIIEVKKITGIGIFPNPNDGIDFNLQVDSEYDRTITMSIVGLNGALFYRKIYELKTSRPVLDISPASSLEPGIYMVVIEIGQERYVNKMVVK